MNRPPQQDGPLLTLPERVTHHDPTLICEVGSTAHGVATGSDDRDVVAIVYDPWDSLHGLGSFGTSVFRTAAEREGRQDARSQPGDLDLVVHGLRKFCTLALKGNPSVQMLLFQEPLWQDPRFAVALDAIKPAFASQRVVRAHMGYLHEQLERLMGRRGQKNVKRPELVERYGYDTKYAGHIVRLAHQGISYAIDAKIPVPLQPEIADLVLGVRRGEWSLLNVEEYATNAMTVLEDLLERNPAGLPPRPDSQAVSTWLHELYTDRLCREVVGLS